MLVGVDDDSVSYVLKCWIQQGRITVVGVIGEGTSKELSANWSSPFEGTEIGSIFGKVGGALQSGAIIESTAGMTSTTTLSSHQVWDGNQPHSFNINLLLYALKNPKLEVENAIMELEKMWAPEVNAKLPIDSDFNIGRAPSSVIVNIGRNVIVSNCVIESISVPLDGPRDENGHLLKADVQLTIQTNVMLNRSQIVGTYG